MKPQRDINLAFALTVFGWLINGLLWSLAFRARTTLEGARSYLVFGAGIGIAMQIAAWQYQAKGLERRRTDKDRGAARVVRIMVAFHVLIAVVAGVILLARTA